MVNDRHTVHLAIEHAPDTQCRARIIHIRGIEQNVGNRSEEPGPESRGSASGKKGFVMSETTSPSIRLRPETNDCAFVLGR